MGLWGLGWSYFFEEIHFFYLSHVRCANAAAHLGLCFNKKTQPYHFNGFHSFPWADLCSFIYGSRKKWRPKWLHPARLHRGKPWQKNLSRGLKNARTRRSKSQGFPRFPCLASLFQQNCGETPLVDSLSSLRRKRFQVQDRVSENVNVFLSFFIFKYF